MSALELDKDALATLTDEERAAIEDGELSDEEIAALKNVAGEGVDEDDEDEDDDDETAPVDGKPATLAATPAATPPADTPAVEPAPAEANFRYMAELPADYEARVKSVNDAADTLAESFKAGDIDFDEYRIQLAELTSQREELTTLRIKAEISSEANSQSVEREWRTTVLNFTQEAAKNSGIDYAKDAAKQADLDLFVKALANDQQHAEKPMRWFLDEAHRRVMALHGVAPTATKSDKDNGKPNRKPPVDALPASLAHVPGGTDASDVGGGEFADLDGLEGLDLEQAIARMNPAQREKYAALG